MLLSRIQTHDSVFVAGKNFGNKLDVTRVQGLVLAYEPSTEYYHIWYNKEFVRLPKTSIQLDCPLETKDILAVPEIKVIQEKPVQAAQPNLKIQAQVSSPTGFVFEKGQGKTGQEKIR